MVTIEKNFFLTSSLLIFASVIFAYRIWDVFFKKYGSQGKVYYPWTLVALSILHSLVGILSVLEYIFVVHEYNLLIGVTSLLIFIIGQWLRNLAITILGRNHSPHIEIKEDHRLVDAHVYGRLRNPYYVGVILEVGSTPLIFNAYYAFLIFLLFYLPVLLSRIFLEEKVLLGRWGDVYRSYKRSVPAFLPKLNRRKRL